MKRVVDEVKRKQEQGGFAVDGGDDEERGEEDPVAAEVEQVKRCGEEGETG